MSQHDRYIIIFIHWIRSKARASRGNTERRLKTLCTRTGSRRTVLCCPYSVHDECCVVFPWRKRVVLAVSLQRQTITAGTSVFACPKPKKINAKVHVRGLPFYSDLLTTLGPAAAQELTQCDSGGLDFEGALQLPWRTRLGRTAPAHECKVERYVPGRRTKELAQGCRVDRTSSSSRDWDCTISMSFGREVAMIEKALLRRERLGVERWLQLQRSLPPGYTGENRCKKWSTFFSSEEHLAVYQKSGWRSCVTKRASSVCKKAKQAKQSKGWIFVCTCTTTTTATVG